MKEYHVALSFAGEEREYVEAVATKLKENGVRVFYDDFEKVTLWGKNLYEYFIEIYRDKAHYTIMFISEAYKKKAWTNHERRSAQERALWENKEYLLPAMFNEGVEVPGLLKSVAYIGLQGVSPDNFADMVIKKLVEGKVFFPDSSTGSFIKESEFEKELRLRLQKPAKPIHHGWTYVAYFCHTRNDQVMMESVRSFFQRSTYRVFSYSRLRPGDPFSKLVDGIEYSKYFYYCVGKNTEEKTWQPEELEAALYYRNRREVERIIPVILPGGAYDDIPIQLGDLEPVDLREQFDPTGFKLLTMSLG